jgi:ATP-dependent helicase HrpA
MRTLHSLQQLGTPAGGKQESPLSAELLALVPPRFPERVSFDRLVQLPRYLKALLTRIERAALNPVKDQERVRQLQPYVDALRRFEAASTRNEGFLREVEELRWMLEEFKVSLFAQELGTAFPVSAKRLEQKIELVRKAQ